MRALLLLLPSFLFSAFFGCIDEPSQYNTFSISGQVVDRNGFPCPNVEISEYKIYSSISDEEGFFNLNGIFPPYNLSFTRQEISDHNYIGLKKSQTIISLDWYSEYIQNRALVEVEFPQLGQSRCLYLKFISDKFDFQPLNGYAVEGQGSCIFDVYICPHESSNSGKLLYLEYYTKYWNGIFSYEKFGMKNVTIYKNASNIIHFSGDEINYNPEEITIEPDIIKPVLLPNNYTELYLSFNSPNKNSELRLGPRNNFYNGIFKYPLLDFPGYKIKFVNTASGPNYFSSEKWTYINPGENARIIHYSPPKLLLPEDGAENITDTTVFKFKDNSEPGIYKIVFNLANQIQEKPKFFYTGQKNLTLRDLWFYGFNYYSNAVYIWYVQKYSGFNSIDDFVSSPYITNNACTSIEHSNQYSFTTPP